MNEHWESSNGTEFLNAGRCCRSGFNAERDMAESVDAATAGNEFVEQWIREWTKQTDYVLFCHSPTAPRRPKVYGFLRISDIFYISFLFFLDL